MTETADKIMERLVNDIPERYDVKPGTYTYDVEKPVANEFENAYDKIDNLDKQFYAATATGKYLEARVGEVGLTRKNATTATGHVTVKGDAGASIPVGTKAAAGNVIFNITDSAVISADGTATVPVICDKSGLQGNVGIGKINRFPITIQGLLSVSNTEPTTGGSDQETDNELRARYTEYMSHPITSGNKWQYIAWAKSVDGVGDAKCKPLWNGNGTVQVIIVDAERQLASDELINKVQAYIDDQHPIGALPTVTTAEVVNINISCNLTSDSEAPELIKENIRAYLREVSFRNGYVSYAKIGQVIMGTEGVIDYTDLRVNDGMVNIQIAETEIAVLGGVNLG